MTRVLSAMTALPAAALRQSVEYYLQLEGFSADQVLENKLRSRPGE